MDLPQKKSGIEMHEVNGQFVVYESSRDAVHYLNPSAALVLELCDGSHSPDEIAALVGEALRKSCAGFGRGDGGHLFFCFARCGQSWSCGA